MPSKRSKNVFTLFLLSGGAILLLFITFLNLSIKNEKVVVLGVKTSPIEELSYWQELVAKNPTYRDGYIQIARIEIEMGDVEASSVALQTAKAIDPNSLNLLKAERELLTSK